MSNSKILLIAPSWLGDFVISLSLINALKQDNKNIQIDLLVNENLYDIAKLTPNISNIIVTKTKHGKLSFFYRLQLGLKLKKNNYSKCYVLTNSLKSSLIPFFAGIKKRIGYLGESRYGLINTIVKKIDRSKGMVNRYLNLIDKTYSTDFSPMIDTELNLESLSNIYGFNKKYIVLCPDAEYGSAKKWPLERWIELSKKLIPDYQVLFVGLDSSIKNSIEEINSKDILNLIGKTNLVDVINIINHAHCVVSNDSGLMHVSAALDSPIIAIFGSSSPHYTPPLVRDDKHAIVYKELECSPCYKRTCPLGHTNCLNMISAEDVYEEFKKLTK